MTLRMSFIMLPLALTGCLLNVGNGPMIGECADYPDGIYTYGEIGLGTCLSGPVDIDFLEIEGRTWLAVSNADPSSTFGLVALSWSTSNPLTETSDRILCTR